MERVVNDGLNREFAAGESKLNLFTKNSQVKKYFVKYIVVGDKERETYTDLSTDIIKQYCTESFRSNDSVIYECKL